MSLLLKVLSKPGEYHPFIDLNHCVNRRQKRLECHACVEVCPKQVYDVKQAEKPQWTECQNCGLCVAACTARCIAPSTTNVNRQLGLSEGGGAVAISCKEHPVEQSHVEPCIATLPWEYLAYLALGKKLILNVAPCRTCLHEDCVALLRKQLIRLKAFLGEERFAESVELCEDEGKKSDAEAFSRRDLFRKGLQKTAQSASTLMQDAGQDHVSGMAYRKLLADRVREIYRSTEPQDRKPYGMAMPWFSKDCYGCGTCARLCPNQALTVSEETEGARLISITPWKCVGCGVCASVCVDHGIQGLHTVQVPYLDPLPMAKAASRSCARCGRPIPPKQDGDHCASCKQKLKHRR